MLIMPCVQARPENSCRGNDHAACSGSRHADGRQWLPGMICEGIAPQPGGHSEFIIGNLITLALAAVAAVIWLFLNMLADFCDGRMTPKPHRKKGNRHHADRVLLA